MCQLGAEGAPSIGGQRMYPTKLIQLIETHADRLAEGLLHRVEHSDRCRQLLGSVPHDELRRRVYEIYRHLNEWLRNTTQSEIEERYLGIGMRRARQGVPFSELFWAITTVKEHLYHYLEQEGLLEEPVDLYGDWQLLQSVEQFFDHAVYFAAMGYESVIHRHREATAGNGARVA